jgi:hypothetical protein
MVFPWHTLIQTSLCLRTHLYVLYVCVCVCVCADCRVLPNQYIFGEFVFFALSIELAKRKHISVESSQEHCWANFQNVITRYKITWNILIEVHACFIPCNSVLKGSSFFYFLSFGQYQINELYGIRIRIDKYIKANRLYTKQDRLWQNAKRVAHSITNHWNLQHENGICIYCASFVFMLRNRNCIHAICIPRKLFWISGFITVWEKFVTNFY